MILTQRMMLLTKRFSIATALKYFKHSDKRIRAAQRQHVGRFSTMKSFNFDFCNSSAVQHSGQLSKQYCSVAKSEAVESRETTEENKSLVKEFNDIDLSDSDLISTFRELLRVWKSKGIKRNATLEDDFQEFVSSDKFKNYCNSLEQRLPLLTADELRLLLNCDLFCISSSSILMQKIYHLIIEKINEYNVTHLLAIYSNINKNTNKNKKCFQCQVLLKVCRKCIKHKLSKSSYESINYNDIASFCEPGQLPPFLQQSLLKLLRNNFHIVHNHITLNALCKMFGAFSNFSCVQYFRPKMFNVLKSRISENFTFRNTCDLLMGLRNLFNNGLNYDEDFLNTLTEKNQVIAQKNIHACISLCFLYLHLEHLCWPLIKQLETLLSDSNVTLYSLPVALKIAKILSCAYCHPLGYKGDDVHHIECIKKFDSLNFKMVDLVKYVEWCLCVTVLGTERKFEYLNDLFQHLTQTYKNKEIEVELPAATAEAIITLSAFSKKHFPADVTELPEQLLEKCFEQLLKANFSQYIPQDIFPGNSEVYKNCTSGMHHYINFAVVIQNETFLKEGNQSSDEIFRIENIQRQPNSKLVLYQIYGGPLPIEYKNCSFLPGTIQLYLNTFEQFDCKVVLLSQKHMNLLPKKAFLQYIASKMKEGLAN